MDNKQPDIVAYVDGQGNHVCDYNKNCICRPGRPNDSCHHWVKKMVDPKGRPLTHCEDHSVLTWSGELDYDSIYEILAKGISFAFFEGEYYDTCTKTEDKFDGWYDGEEEFNDDVKLYLEEKEKEKAEAPKTTGYYDIQMADVTYNGIGDISYRIFGPNFQPLPSSERNNLETFNRFVERKEQVLRERGELSEVLKKQDKLISKYRRLKSEPFAVALEKEVIKHQGICEGYKDEALKMEQNYIEYKPWIDASKKLKDVEKTRSNWEVSQRNNATMKEIRKIKMVSYNLILSIKEFDDENFKVDAFGRTFNQYISSIGDSKIEWKDRLKKFLDYYPYDKWYSTYIRYHNDQMKEQKAKKMDLDKSAKKISKTTVMDQNGNIVTLDKAVDITYSVGTTRHIPKTRNTDTFKKEKVSTPNPNAGFTKVTRRRHPTPKPKEEIVVEIIDNEEDDSDSDFF